MGEDGVGWGAEGGLEHAELLRPECKVARELTHHVVAIDDNLRATSCEW